MLSPLVSGICFATVLIVALEQFSEDPDILSDLFQFREQQARVGPETAMECFCRAVWGMLYANNACIASRSPRELERMMAALFDVLSVFGLTVPDKKAETMSLPIPHAPTTPIAFTKTGQQYRQTMPFFTSGERLRKARSYQPRLTAGSV